MTYQMNHESEVHIGCEVVIETLLSKTKDFSKSHAIM